MPDDLPVSPELSPPSLRRTLLIAADDEGWVTYQSENPPGYTDGAGHTYDTVTYTLLIPPPQGYERPDDQTDLTERILRPDDVVGYVLALADRYGGMPSIAFRPELA
ncbi:hypothetical protein [Actinoplanes sp. NBRC 101535]|uniref:hypothetical protein n=1 Tax=Actinoplanes sp. NBRC 101535 TaxID=3032196 RepID=UPI0024A1F275|nr:hypothetical protein [Actinoplanes sp. NBRC 101535]GLY08328.1 hypothetical protein Acsp01_87070 [Actinoplanes sp. NBRC 101535]